MVQRQRTEMSGKCRSNTNRSVPVQSHKNGQTQQLKTTYLFKLLSNVFSLWYAHGRTLHCTAALWSLCCVNGSTNKKKKKSLLTTGVPVCIVCLFCSLSGCPLAAMGKLISQAQQKKSGEWETVLCLHAFSSVQLDCPFIYLCGSCDGSPSLFQFCVVSAVGDCVYTRERQLHNDGCPYATVGTPAYLFASFLILIHERRTVFIF